MNLIKTGLYNALGTLVYVIAVAVFMTNASHWFGQADNLFSPVVFLMLFVLSAAITGGLVLGKPLMMFLNGQKTESVKLFMYTVGWLAVGTIVAMLISLSLKK